LHIDFVHAGLVPGMHVLLSLTLTQDMDGRDKPGHDDAKGAMAQPFQGKGNPRIAASRQRICFHVPDLP
jgi:hypothetical protein